MSGQEDNNGAGFTDGFDESEQISDDELVTISDGDRDRDCVVLVVADYEGHGEFALLAPADQLSDVDEDQEEEELELFIFHYTVDEDGVETFTGVEDEEVWSRVRDFFSTLMDQDEDDQPVAEA